MAAANDTTIEGMMGGLPGVRQFGLNTNQAVDFSGAPSVALPGGTTIAGTSNVTSTSATAFTVAAAGTNYGLQVDESATNAVTGLKIASTATGTNLLLSVISSGTNDGVTLKAKGSSSVVVAAGTDNSGVFQVQNSAGSNIAFNVDLSAGSNATGLSIQSSAAGTAPTLQVTSSGTNEGLIIKSKGTGKLLILPGSDTVTALQVNNAGNSTNVFNVDTSNIRVGVNNPTPQSTLHVSGKITSTPGDTSLATPGYLANSTDIITGGVTDAYASGIRLSPTINAATAQTVTRLNYIDLNTPVLGGVGPAAVTNAAVFRFDAAAGTHKAVDSATTKTTPTGVDAWVKINLNGTLAYIPAYLSKTA